MQIYCCETQTSCQTTTAATAEKLIWKFCRVKLFAKCKREISKQEMSSYLWWLSSSFLPYMSSLRDNESWRGGLGLNNRVKDVVCLLHMMMINDDTSKTHEDNVKINYRVNNKIFCALWYLISHVLFLLLSSIAHNYSLANKSSSTIWAVSFAWLMIKCHLLDFIYIKFVVRFFSQSHPECFRYFILENNNTEWYLLISS